MTLLLIQNVLLFVLSKVKPIDVEIVTARHTLFPSREVEIICESRGSRPPAQITWFKDNRELTHSRYSQRIRNK
jgi:hypothetical protein